MFDDNGRAVQFHLLNFDHCVRQVIYARVHQIVNPNSPLRKTDEPYCCSLAKSFRHHEYYYWESATYAAAMHNVDAIKLLKDGYCTAMLDSLHGGHSVEMLRDENGKE